ncbi:hypothetical protein LSTR_LSTR014805 [Laodelphax striatellus]|uniref:THAP-type domain-containing protein n=1 Tax=Laodelphax striatellus TaxID=195883 RepID=A0A482WTJ6_LAOST|nr:hypothetical protein LSTR_LSTR014805 [Laodelphax striatellus]
MPISCSVATCTNYENQQYNIGRRKKPIVSFHRFPKDPIRRAEWVAAVNRPNWTPYKTARICSAHFKEEDFDRDHLSSCVRLKKRAVPSIFELFPSYPLSKFQRNAESKENKPEVVKVNRTDKSEVQKIRAKEIASVETSGKHFTF